MRPPHRPPPELAAAPFATRDALPLVSRDQLESAAYERLCRGAYRAAAGHDRDRAVGAPEERPEVPYADRVAGFAAVLPQRAVLVGRSAAWALRAWEPWPDDPVEVNCSPSGSVRHRDGLELSARSLATGDVVRTRRGTTTTPLRTALDLACLHPLQTAVPVLDALMASTGLRRDAVLAQIAGAGPGRGTRRAVTTLALTDPRAESPRESLLRLVVHAAGLPTPEVQHVVPLPTGRRARLDLAWPEVEAAVEYDGWPHDDAGRRSEDLARHNALRALGWVVIQVDAAGFGRPDVYLAQLRAALGR